MILQWFNMKKWGVPWIFIIFVCSLTRNDVSLFLIIQAFCCHSCCSCLSSEQRTTAAVYQKYASIIWKPDFQCKFGKWMNPTTFLLFFFLCNSLETVSTEGRVYPSTVWKCHPLRHDSRFGNTVNNNYLVNPGTHCKNCSFPSYKHIAERFGAIKQQLFSQNGRNRALGCSLDAARTRALSPTSCGAAGRQN